MLKLLSQLASLIGLTGLTGCILVVGIYTHPSISLLVVLWNSLAAYVLIIMLMLAGQTLIEMLIVIVIITALILISIFAAGDMLSDNIQLLLWSLLCAAWYMPVFVLSLGTLLDVEENNASGKSIPDNAEEEEKQAAINKSLKRRKRKLAKRNKHEIDRG